MPKARAKRSTDTELLHEAQSRATAEKLFHNLLDAAPDAILEVDSSGRIVRAITRSRNSSVTVPRSY